MTRDEFKNLLLQADREFALQKRLLERQLDTRYNKHIGMGFRTPSAQAAYIEQLQASKNAELLEGLKNLRGDIEAKYFGTKGQQGLEKTLPSTSQILLVPTNPNQPI